MCGKLETRYQYSSTLGWNTFPAPGLTETDKQDLTRCAEDIPAMREVYFPQTIADLYARSAIPPALVRAHALAHARNNKTVERIYIGRPFRNDTERLETLFELYTKMTEGKGTG